MKRNMSSSNNTNKTESVKVREEKVDSGVTFWTHPQVSSEKQKKSKDRNSRVPDRDR